MNHNITNKEKLRQDIEKILWREYSEDHSPNFEEVSEEIMALFCHQQPEREHLPNCQAKCDCAVIIAQNKVVIQQPEKECDNCKLVEKNKVGYCAMHPKPKEENKCYPPLANEKYLLSITHPEPSREWEKARELDEILTELYSGENWNAPVIKLKSFIAKVANEEYNRGYATAKTKM